MIELRKMLLNRKCFTKFSVCLLMLFSVHVYAESKLDMQTAITETFGCSDCMDWKISGVCFWLACSIFGCDIETSVRVSHNIPDVLIAAFNGDSPLQGRGYTDQPTDGAIATDGATTANFKNVDVIGNPAILLYEALWQSTGLWCASEAEALLPYYLSSLSNRWPGISWNTNYVEQITGIGKRSTVGQFGRLYPRCGWTVQSDDVKAAALTAVRAAHVVTRSSQSHIYIELDGDTDERTWGPGEFNHEDADTGRFQMLLPIVEHNSELLGVESRGWSEGKFNDEKKYVWAFWRPYSCCQPQGAFLYSVEF